LHSAPYELGAFSPEFWYLDLRVVRGRRSWIGRKRPWGMVDAALVGEGALKKPLERSAR
jgi:hypothetical protein